MKIPYNKLIVKQEVEMLEVFTKFETKNKYSVQTEQGQQVFYAFEESSFLGRQVLGNNRPISIKIIDQNQQELLHISRPFFFMFSKFTVEDAKGTKIGNNDQRFAWFSRKFEIKNPTGQVIFTCISKFVHPWTYKVFRNGQEVAQILKKWSGAGKEMFTDADTFQVDFGQLSDDNEKALILALAFGIDLVFFEKKG